MRLMLAAVLWVAAAAVAAADGFARGDVPAWVEPVDLPALSDELRAASFDGVAYVLADTQVAFEGDVRVSYGRFATQAIDRAGLEYVATVQTDFDPHFESLTLTHIDPIRDGQVTHLRDQLSEEIYRRETRLEAGIVDGTLTVHVQVPDLRVGDIVDYGFVIRRTEPIAGANRATRAELEFGVPVALVRHSVIWPKDWPIRFAPLPERIERRSEDRSDHVRYEWRRTGHIPFPDEARVPVAARREAVVEYSAWADWAPLSAELSPHYLAAYDLPESWIEKLAEIRRRYSTGEWQATAALRLVQDEIRYVGIEVGAGGYFARPPSQVIESGFGDCKDKSLLLAALLRALHIEAHVALTDLDEGPALGTALPRLSAFDHMIVRARIGGKDYWMDPTGSHEAGSLSVAVTPDCGFALPLAGSETADLSPLAPRAEMGWRTDLTEIFDFGLFGVSLTVKSEFEGQAANWQRRNWASTPTERIGRDYLDYYARLYPGIQQLLPPDLVDDPVANRVRINERYFLPRHALVQNGLREDFRFSSDDFGNPLDISIAGRRETPMDLGLPERSYKRIYVRNAPISFDPPERIAIDNEAFFYEFSGTVEEEGSMMLKWVFRTKERTVPADRVAAVVADARRIEESTYWSWNLLPE